MKDYVKVKGKDLGFIIIIVFTSLRNSSVLLKSVRD